MDFKRKLYDIVTRGASEGAIQEGIWSQLPGRENGPADAYRHITLAAELTRRYGEARARQMLDFHEITGKRDGQSPEAEAMDRYNNEIGIKIGRDAKNWGEIAEKSRKEIDFGSEDGERARWLSEGDWKRNPIDDATKKEIPTGDPRLNWPNPTWPEDNGPYPSNEYHPGDGNINDGDNVSGDPFSGDPFTGLPWPGSTDEIDKLREAAIDAIRKERELATKVHHKMMDPLTLDLNGDGVQSLPVSAGVHFDHDGNGFAEGTGWVRPGDGLLAWDRNGNGKIDTGAELFGNFTPLANGVHAENGFAALQELDSNSDGRIDASDARFADLRVWNDANSNAVTDDGELMTLQAAGVASLSTAFETSNKVDGQGNDRRQIGQFTRADGTWGGLQDIWFDADNARPSQTPFSPVAISPEIEALPDIQGFGTLRNLHDAMALDPALKEAVQAFVSEVTVQGREQLASTIIMKWTGADKVVLDNSLGFDRQKLYALDIASGEGPVNRGYNPIEQQDANNFIESGYRAFQKLVYGELGRQAAFPLLDGFELSIGQGSSVSLTLNGYAEKKAVNPKGAMADLVNLVKYYGTDLHAMGWNGFAMLRSEVASYAGDADMSNFLASLNVALGSAELGDHGALIPTIMLGQSGNDVLHGSADTDILDGGGGDDTLWVSNNDVIVFGVGSGHDHTVAGASYGGSYGSSSSVVMGVGIRPADVALSVQNGDSRNVNLVLTLASGDSLTIPNWYDESDGSRSKDDPFGISQVIFEDGTIWSGLDMYSRVVEPVSGDIVRNGIYIDDVISGGAGNDHLNGQAGNDILFGRAGNDSLDGGSGNDILIGGSGDDVLNDELNRVSDDFLDGGAGQDSLNGGAGSDTYYFARGYGADTIHDFGGKDTIIFGPTITAADLSIHETDQGLLININNSADQLRIAGWSSYPNSQPNSQIEKILFDDGTQWNVSDIISHLTPSVGTEGADSIAGTAGNDNISGLGGRDFIYGGSGDDVIDGGAGNDSVTGGTGNDTLAGGTGNDVLDGNQGSDTYVFGRGDGNDVIYDARYKYGSNQPINSSNDIDTIKLDVNPQEVTIGRGGAYPISNGSLVFRINGTADTLEVYDWFNQDNSDTLRVQFADGTIWDAATVRANTAVSATAGDDYLYGTPQGDTISGGGGNDTIFSGAGNDTINGGSGDDSLDGGSGSDTYLFGFGSGQDTIREHDYTPGVTASVDTIKMSPGVQSQDITITNDWHSLYLTLTGGTDKIKLWGWMSDQFSRIERVDFSDGTSLDLTKNMAGPINGTSGNDTLTGTAFNDVINGGDGNDYIDGNGGSDTLIGGNGNDTLLTTLRGKSGINTLDGGAGDDLLYGGNGDRYVFGNGYGIDTIYRNSDDTGTIVFNAGVSASDLHLVSMSDNTLQIQIKNSPDRLNIRGWFNPNAWDKTISVFEFADGSSWDLNEIRNQIDLNSTEGDDYLIGSSGVDNLSGGSGNDTLFGYQGSDTLDGGAGSDALYGLDGNDILSGGTGGDSLYGGNGDDTYRFSRGFGADTVYEGDLYTAKQEGSNNRIVFGPDITESDIVVTGDNQYTPGSQSNLYLTVLGTTDKITLSGWFNPFKTNVDYVEFSNGFVWNRTDLLSKYFALERGGTMYGSDFADNLTGDGTDDHIEGWSGDDTLNGADGNDELFGDDGNDVLNGGRGNDALYGGIGDDTYIFERGSGQDTIADFDRGNGSQDRILFGSDILPEDVLVARNDSDIILALRDTEDSLSIRWYSNHGFKIEQVSFANGIVWDAALLQQKADDSMAINGTSNVDNLAGSAAVNRIFGLGGDDVLSGLSGDDTLDGGAGNDHLNGGTGDDILIGGVGNDTYVVDSQYDNVMEYAEEGIDVVEANIDYVLPDHVENLTLAGVVATNGAGNDLANVIVGNAVSNFLSGAGGADNISGGAGNDRLYGGDGNDVLGGGTGNDSLEGGTGDDVYLFERGDGFDMITDIDGNVGNVDTVRFGATISSTGIRVTRDFSSLYLSIDGTTDRITVANWFADDAHKIEQVEFADGTVWTADDLITKAVMVATDATDGDDILRGTDADDTVYGLGGNDLLIGVGGNDILSGDDGNDLLEGGAGQDILMGGAGDDTYVLNVGDSSPVNNVAEKITDQQGRNTINFGAGITEQDIQIERKDSGDLALRYGADDVIDIQGGFAGSINQYHFADGHTIDADAFIRAHLTTPKNISTYLGDETVYGDGANNVITSTGERTVIAGGAGHDMLKGIGQGNTYRFAKGDGTDVIWQMGRTPDSTIDNVIVLTGGIKADDLKYSVQQGDLVISYTSDPADNIRINQVFSLWGAPTIQKIQFDDGIAIDLTSVLVNDLQVNASVPGEIVSGTGLAETLTGLDGNEVLEGHGGQDTLIGGKGDDFLVGGGNGDRYRFQLGDGHDTIYLAGELGSDVTQILNDVPEILFEAGIDPAGLSISNADANGQPTNFRISYGAQGDTIDLIDNEGANFGRVRVRFADGSTTTLADLIAAGPVNSVQGSASDNLLNGSAFNDLTEGLDGNDQLFGFDGDDTLLGGAGDDVLYGGTMVSVEDGNDILDGGAGNDVLHGGGGHDTYVLSVGSGVDSIVDAIPGSDVIRLNGISLADLHVSRQTKDLLLSTQNGDGFLIQDYFESINQGKTWQLVLPDNSVQSLDDWAAAQLSLPVETAPMGDMTAAKNAFLVSLHAGLTSWGLKGWGLEEDYPENSDSYRHAFGGIVHTNTSVDGDYWDLDPSELVDYSITTTHVEVDRDETFPIVAANKSKSIFHSVSSLMSDGSGGVQIPAGWVPVVVNDSSGSQTITGYIETQSATASVVGYVPHHVHDEYDTVLNLQASTFNVQTVTGSEQNDDIYTSSRFRGRVDAGDGDDSVYLRGDDRPSDPGRGLGGLSDAWQGELDELFGFASNLISPYYVQDVGGFEETFGFFPEMRHKGLGVFLDGGAGNDWLVSTEADDVIVGGRGDDFLQGGTGSDTYLINMGDGRDVLFDGALPPSVVNDEGMAHHAEVNALIEHFGATTPKDTVVFGAGINLQNIRYNMVSRGPETENFLTWQPDTTAMRITWGTDDSLIVVYGAPNLTFNGTLATSGIEHFKFVDGTVLTLQQFLAHVTRLPIPSLSGGSGDDIFSVDNVDTSIIESANGGIDTVNSTVSYTLPDNVEILNLTGLARINGTGNAMANTLVGNSAANKLDGGAGDDNLQGGAGNDVYLFKRGDGIDIIEDYDNAPGNIDTVRFDWSISSSDIGVSSEGNDLYLNINGTTDQVILRNWLGNDANKIERVEFADGTAWDAAALFDRLLGIIEGGDGNDFLTGTDVNDTMQGLGGNDTLYGNSGNDTLDGGVGYDYLDGGTGDDVYLFKRGDGHDTISDYDGTIGNIDTLRFDATVSADNVKVTRDNSNLYLSINGTMDRIALSNWFSGDEYKIEQVQFADGTVWHTADLLAKMNTGTERDDDLQGDEGNNTIQGLGGDDWVSGQGGDDTLDGGVGDDSLYGGTGNDVYLFGRGAGGDYIYDYDDAVGNIDTVRFDATVSAGDIKVSRDQYSLYLSIDGTADRITLANWFADDASKIEQVEFADGTVWGTADLFAKASTTTSEGDDFLMGTDADDVIQGLAGADQLVGYAGNDTLDGGAGNDQLYGFAGNDTLDGGAGDDTLIGDTGDDVLMSGLGDDYLQGDAGNDTYYVEKGDGHDTIYDFDSTFGNIDTITFAPDVSPGDVTVSDNPYGDLYLTFNNGASRVGVVNWFNDDAYKVERVLFSDGTAWDAAELTSRVTTVTATEYGDVIAATSQNGIIDGLGGDDRIYGSEGNDVLSGGLGNDYAQGNLGNDILDGGEGEDDLEDWDGNNALDAGGGDDYLYTDSGVNFMAGGKGIDYIDSWGDHNVIGFNAGDGADTLYVGNALTLSLGGGISVDDLSLTVDGGDLILNVRTGGTLPNVPSGDSIRLSEILNDYDSTDRPAMTLQIIGFDIRTYDFNEVIAAFGAAISQGSSGSDWPLASALALNVLTVISPDQVIGGEVAYRYARDGSLAALMPDAIRTTLSDIDFGAAAQLVVTDSVQPIINGTQGNDIVQGGMGNDTLHDSSGNNLFQADTGDDAMAGGVGNELFIGGAGNDLIDTGTGADVVAFNRGNGQDIVHASAGKDNTLSLGAGIQYADLLFQKTGNDLILVTGTDEQVMFKNWYADINNHSVANLQMVIEGTADYDAASASQLNNRKVTQFDFGGLVTQFDQEREASPALTSWALSSSLLDFYLRSSDTAAIGGDLAYQYAKNGNLSSMSMTPAQALLASTQFGTANQDLQAATALKDLSPSLM